MGERLPLVPTEVRVEPVLALQVDGRSGTAPDEIGRAMSAAFATMGQYQAAHSLAYAGPPRAVYTTFDESGTTFTLACPVSAVSAEPVAEGAVRVGTLPGGPALRFTHRGPYEGLRATYDAIARWLEAEGRVTKPADWAKFGPMWEEYVTDPASTPAEDLVTHIYVPTPES